MNTDKITRSIDILRVFAPRDGKYWLAFSGGKDSICLLQLANEANVAYEAHYSVTTMDPPEVLQHMRKHYPEVVWDRPEKPLWAAIKDHGMPPTRIVRWCCREYKEGITPDGARLLVGVRKDESVSRAKNWKMAQVIRRRGKRLEVIAPLLEWTEDEVWSFIKDRGLAYPALYDEGRSRLGCVMCPMAKNKLNDAERWPKLARLWRKGIYLLWDRLNKEGKLDKTGKWGTPEALWDWWLLGKDNNSKKSRKKCTGLDLFNSYGDSV